MNLKRFAARNAREALGLVKAAFGDDAVVVSTKPCAEGVEVLAMAGESLAQIERLGLDAEHVSTRSAETAASASAPRSASLRERVAPPMARVMDRLIHRAAERLEASQAVPRAGLPDARTEPSLEPAVAEDVAQLQMSTLSFQDYVRERMVRRREAEALALNALQAEAPHSPQNLPPEVPMLSAVRERAARREVPVLRDEVGSVAASAASASALAAAPISLARQAAAAAAAPARGTSMASASSSAGSAQEQVEVMHELRSMRGLIEQRFGALAFMEKLQRHPRQAALSRELLDAGFSPMLVRKLVESTPETGSESAWAAGVLERNLLTGEREPALEEQGGVHALIGPTGVGKTTSCAKLAAAFATRCGASNLGLITLDAYRVGAHEQLRAYGRILGVPVHTAHDRDSLEDLLELLQGKQMVLIDTAGMAQRDSRTRELLEMLSHPSIRRLLVVNASAQGETTEDQLSAYGAAVCEGVVLSKLDEAVKLAPALDAVIRHRVKVLAVANGQRVPEDWHRLSAQALVQRALKGGGTTAWQRDERDVSLVFTALPASHTFGDAPPPSRHA